MSKELSTAGIINQVNEIKTRVCGLDKTSRVFYEIWGFNPASSSEFQLYGKGNNRKEACYPFFERELDAVLASPTIVHIKVHLKDGRKDLGSSEIVIKPAYQIATPALLPIPKEEKHDITQPQATIAQPQNGLGGVNFIQMLGQAFLGVTGLNGVNDEMGGLGMVMAIQEKVIGDKYEKQRQEDRLQGIIEKNAVLKSENEKLQAEIDKLNGEIDDNEDKIDELEKHIAEYEKLNPKRDMISGLAGQVAQNALLGIISKTKYAGLLGLDEPAPQPSQMPQPSQPVIIEAVDDSPRAKAKQQITAWIDTLGDNDFTTLYQLLTLFAKGAPIASCLQWITGNNETQTPAPVSFGDDDNE